MPVVGIEIGKQYTKEQETALIMAVHKAVQEAFQISNNDVFVRLFVHEPHRFTIPVTTNNPPAYTNPELYTFVNIECYVGRNLEIKRNLYRKIAENLEAFGIPKNHIKIVVRDWSKENWGVQGGQAAADL